MRSTDDLFSLFSVLFTVLFNTVFLLNLFNLHCFFYSKPTVAGYKGTSHKHFVIVQILRDLTTFIHVMMFTFKVINVKASRLDVHFAAGIAVRCYSFVKRNISL